jgi:hypothetical protein
MSGIEEPIPFIELNLAGEDFKATPLNSQLFTFAGHTVIGGMAVANETFNHVFLHTHADQETDDEVMRGTYIFQPEIVQQMGAAMIRYGFPCRINQRVVQDCDIDAYQTYVGQIADYEAGKDSFEIPEDWLDGNA